MSEKNGLHDSTPPLGLKLDAIKALNPPEAVLYLSERMREQGEELVRVRFLAESASTHSYLANVSLGQLQTKLQRGFEAARERDAEVRALIGTAPVIIDARRSKSGQHTPAELEEMERGTGLAGVVGALAAQVSRLSSWRMMLVGGLGGALGTGLASAAPAGIKALLEAFGG